MGRINRGRQRTKKPTNPPVLDPMEVADGWCLLLKISDRETDNAKKDQLSEDLLRRFWTVASKGNLEARSIVEKVFDLQSMRIGEVL